MPDMISMAEGAVITIITVIATLLIGVIIAKLLGKTTKHILAQAEVNRLLKQSGIKAIDQRIGAIVEYVVYAVTILFILQQLGLTRIVLGIIIIATALTIGASIALTFRNLVPNLVQGIHVKKRLHDKIGKEIKIGCVKGKLVNVGAVHCIIVEKEKHYIPHTYTIKQLQAS